MLDTAINEHRAGDAEEIHLNAYNAAFYELGLRWHWDAETYRNLRRHAANGDAVRIYLEAEQAHLLKAYDVEFLSHAIENAKRRRYEAMMTCGARRAADIDWAAMQSVEVGV